MRATALVEMRCKGVNTLRLRDRATQPLCSAMPECVELIISVFLFKVLNHYVTTVQNACREPLANAFAVLALPAHVRSQSVCSHSFEALCDHCACFHTVPACREPLANAFTVMARSSMDRHEQL